MLIRYYHRIHFKLPSENSYKHCFWIIIKEFIPNSTFPYQSNISKQYLLTIIIEVTKNQSIFLQTNQSIIREFTTNKGYKLLSENSLQRILINDGQITHFIQYFISIIKISHCKGFILRAGKTGGSGGMLQPTVFCIVKRKNGNKGKKDRVSK